MFRIWGPGEKRVVWMDDEEEREGQGGRGKIWLNTA